MIFGCTAVTTSGAAISSPSSSTTPVTRPFVVAIVRTGALTRTSAPKNFAESSQAFETAPMPPSMKPQLATWPSPMSPTEWCMSTYAVPGASGPAHVPMMPLTAMKPFISGVTNQRSSRSVALIVNRRVTSPTVASSTWARSFHASLPRSHRSVGFLDPTWGGVSISIGPRMSEMREIHS